MHSLGFTLIGHRAPHERIPRAPHFQSKSNAFLWARIPNSCLFFWTNDEKTQRPGQWRMFRAGERTAQLSDFKEAAH